MKSWQYKNLHEMTDDEKAQRRIDRNRASAAVSRERKKNYIIFLEQRVTELECQVHALKKEKSDLLWDNCLNLTIEDIDATT